MPDSFRAMHRPGDPFILANAWDAGSAKMLVAMGAKAIATSSAAHAFTLGRPDTGTITRDEALAHAQDLIAAVNVPVSGDFENGFGASPDTCAETVRLAAEIGLAGICIEDTALPDSAPYDAALSTERIRAAASAARALPRDFFLVARADGVLTGHYDTEEAVARIQAFEAAGADGVYVPGPPSMEALGRLVKATDLPFNALVAGPFATHSRAEYAALGVARLSLGSALARATYRTIQTAGEAMFGTQGRFDALATGLPFDVLNPMLQ
ncbi:isocitrate lyase/phosphoenolpyruvate mutase family protein [Antarctobacter sp.]|uniref:isocitrate lyase/PEP mutase family protein n=1 Tax=Antarctobacter sp. TaxID=1872577 RepID=UPI002B26C5BE|nr:isocitrate lyase/phosphoenolpyruvate mutase family protein [Antarctobacter sp.]